MLTPAAMNQSGTKSPAAMTLIVWAMYLPFALTGGSGGGAAWRPRPAEPAHELALTRHLRVRAIRGDPAPRQPVIPCDEGLAPIPHQETRAVHRRVREAPEWIGVIRQKVRRDQRVVLGPDDITAQRAVGTPSRDPVHGRNMAPRAGPCHTTGACAGSVA